MKYQLEIFNREKKQIGEYFTNCKSSLGGAIKMAHLLMDCIIRETIYTDKSSVYVNGSEFGVFTKEEAQHCADVLSAFDTKSVITVEPNVKEIKYV